MAKQETMNAIESTIDTAEETLDTLERIPRVNLNGTTKNQQVLILSSVVVGGAAVGAAAVYFIPKLLARLRRTRIAVVPQNESVDRFAH